MRCPGNLQLLICRHPRLQPLLRRHRAYREADDAYELAVRDLLDRVAQSIVLVEGTSIGSCRR